MKSFYILVLALVVTAVSCKTKEGEPGPSGESSINKQGAMSGKLTYVNFDGASIEQSFSYQYYETLSEAYFTIDEDDNEYRISLSRRDLKDYERRFELNLYGSTDQAGNFITPEQGNIYFSYLNLVNNYLFGFATDGGEGPVYFDEESSTTCDVSNFSFNKTTGRLIFDYTISVSPGNIGSWIRYDNDTPATIIGHVDIIVPSKRQVQMPS